MYSKIIILKQTKERKDIVMKRKGKIMGTLSLSLLLASASTMLVNAAEESAMDYSNHSMAVIATSVLCMSISFGVFAGSAGQSGTTTSGTDGAINTSASLSVDKDRSIATTSAGTSDGITLATSTIFYYLNSSGQKVASSGSGTSRATAGNQSSKGTNATSQHNVTGGSRWGNWSCSLSASA